MATSIYGQAKYGTVTYGGQPSPFLIRVEQWRGGAMVQRLETVLQDASWEYLRFGGCGQGTFTLSAPYERVGEFHSDDEIRVYCRDAAGPGFSLFYRGLICQVTPHLAVKDTVQIGTMGYRLYLDRLTVDATYTTTEVSLIVKDILDNIVVPGGGITYDLADLDATGFIADSVTFLSTAAEAIDLLAKLGSMMEYGVDRNGKFYFRTPSAIIGYRFPFERDVSDASQIYDYSKIVNRVVVRGAGSTKRTRDDAASQAKYGVRATIIQNTAATTNAVADQYGDATLADQAEVAPSATLTLAANRTLLESARPLPLVTLLKRRVKYGQVKYGGAKYQGIYGYKIARISYRVSEIGLAATLELGAARPRLADLIFQLNSNIRAARPT